MDCAACKAHAWLSSVYHRLHGAWRLAAIKVSTAVLLPSAKGLVLHVYADDTPCAYGFSSQTIALWDPYKLCGIHISYVRSRKALWDPYDKVFLFCSLHLSVLKAMAASCHVTSDLEHYAHAYHRRCLHDHHKCNFCRHEPPCQSPFALSVRVPWECPAP